MKLLLLKIFHQLQLLFIASNRGGRHKTYVVNLVLQRTLRNLADDFDLTKAIHKILIEKGQSAKRIDRVSNLRKFPAYAQIIGCKDDELNAPDELIEFTLPRGWLMEYYLVEKPILLHGADMKLRDAHCIPDSERYISPEVEEALAQAIYWEITEFRTSLAAKPIN